MKTSFEMSLVGVTPQGHPRPRLMKNGFVYQPKNNYRKQLEAKLKTLTKEIKAFNSACPTKAGFRVDIEFTQCRSDIDNVAKAVLDALVDAKVIPDDKFVKELFVKITPYDKVHRTDMIVRLQII